MVSDRKLANVVGGKSSRPCDNCIKKRARWYCAADDAFLCQSCDSSVHSANTLARRHERVLLNTASTKSFNAHQSKPKLHVSTTWHRGFTSKARTPRHNKKNKNVSRLDSDHPHEPLFGSTNVLDDDGNNGNVNHSNHIHLVPEISSEQASHEENDRVQLLYRVPIFEPFVPQLCSSSEPVDSIQGTFCENRDLMAPNDHSFEGDEGMMTMGHHLRGFLPSEADLAEFGAHVESLLGKGLEDESFDMKDLGLLDSKDCEGFLKVEDDDEVGYYNKNSIVNDDEALFDVGREASFVSNFHYDPSIATTAGDEEAKEEDKERILEPILMKESNDISIIDEDNKGFESKKMMLRLDYEGVMSAWDDKKSLWTSGERPNFDSGDCYRPDCMGACGTLMHIHGDIGMMSGHVAASMADVIGREARVSRYREKRRTRLFSKKIRYEVRKLNAEKRPRMKGRFVKRSNLL